MGVIYYIEVDGLYYIGSTSDFKNRRAVHRYNYKHHNGRLNKLYKVIDIDNENNHSYFESGAILIYLAEKIVKF